MKSLVIPAYDEGKFVILMEDFLWIAKNVKITLPSIFMLRITIANFIDAELRRK